MLSNNAIPPRRRFTLTIASESGGSVFAVAGALTSVKDDTADVVVEDPVVTVDFATVADARVCDLSVALLTSHSLDLSAGASTPTSTYR